MKKRKVRKWIWWILGTLVLLIAAIQTTLLFFGDELFKESVLLGFRQYSERNYPPEQRPSLNFDDLSINIFTGNLSVTGLHFTGYIHSDSSNSSAADHLDMYVQKAEILDVNFLKFYKSGQLELNEIIFEQPEITWIGASSKSLDRPGTQQRIDLLQQQLTEDIQSYVRSFSFNALKIRNGNLFITEQNAKQNKSSGLHNKFHAQKINITLSDFLIDSASYLRKDRLLFTKDIDIQFANYQLSADSLYLIKADTLGFSTLSREIYLKDVQLLPVSDHSGNTINAKIPFLSLTEVNWQDLYFEDKLISTQLLIDDASVLVEVRADSLKQQNVFRFASLSADSLYQKLGGRFKSLQINDVTIRRAQLSLIDLSEESLEVAKVEDIEMLLSNIQLDSTLQLDSLQKILPADSVSLLAKNIKVYLPDRRHSFMTKSVSLNTARSRAFACDVFFDSLNFNAGVDSLEQLLKDLPDHPLTFDVKLPSLSFFGIQLQALAHHKAALLDSIYVQKPRVKIANFAEQSLGKLAAGRSTVKSGTITGEVESVKSLLYDWSNAKLNLYPLIAPGDTSALFQWLRAGQLQIDSSQVEVFKVNSDTTAFTQVTAIDTFYAFLNNISIDALESESKESSDGKVAVLASDVDLFAQKNTFLLPGERGEGGLLEVQDIKISTLSEEAYFKNIYFWTNPGRPPSSEVWLHEMYIPRVQFSQVDLKKIYTEQDAEIAQLSVYSPQITLNYKYNQQAKRDQKFNYTNLYPQLSSYLNRLYLPSVNVVNAQLRLQQINERGVEPLFVTEKLNVNMRGFYLDSLTRMNRLRPFYADKLSVKAQDYQWHFYPEDDTYPLLGVKGGQLRYDSQLGELEAGQITVVSNTTNKLGLEELKLACNKIMADDIDPYRLIHDQALDVGRVMIYQPSYQVVENKLTERGKKKHEADSRQFLQPDLNSLLNKNLKNIRLRYVGVEQGTVTYLQREAKDTLACVKVTAIDFKARQLKVDGSPERHMHKILYADEIDFSFFADDIRVKKDDKSQQLRIDDAYFSSRDSQLKIEKLQFVPPPELYKYQDKTHFALDASSLHIQGLNFKRAYLYGDFNVQHLNIEESALKVYVGHNSAAKEGSHTSIHEVISPFLSNIKVEKINYPQSSLQVYDKEDQSMRFSSSKIKADISNFYVDQSTFSLQFGPQQNSTARMFFSDDIDISIKDFSRVIDNGLYKISADAIRIKSGDNKILVDGLKLEPLLSRSQVLERYAYSKSIAQLYSDRVELQNVDFKALMEEEKLIVGKINIYEPSLEVYRDNRLPRNLKKKPALHQQLLLNLDQQLSIEELNIFDGLITYAERTAAGEEAGQITFENVNAQALHLSNLPEAIKNNTVSTLHITTKVMGKGLLNVHFSFPLASHNLAFQANGHLGTMDLKALNPMLGPVASVHIKEGINQSMRFEFEGNEDRSEGSMEFRYNDLSVQMIDQQKGRSGLDEKLGTFIANAFVLKANNPKAVFLRIGNINFERDKTRSMFHYWWQSLLSGVKSSIGLDKDMEKTKDFAELDKN